MTLPKENLNICRSLPKDMRVTSRRDASVGKSPVRVKVGRESSLVERDRSGRVKLATLGCIELFGKRWVSVKDLLGDRRSRVYLESMVDSDGPLTEKALSMRLLRYCDQGLLSRIKRGRRYYYRLEEKGEDRIDYLEERLEEQESKSLGDKGSSKGGDSTSDELLDLLAMRLWWKPAQELGALAGKLVRNQAEVYQKLLSSSLARQAELSKEYQELKGMLKEAVDGRLYWERKARDKHHHYLEALEEIDGLRKEAGRQGIRLRTERHSRSPFILVHRRYGEIPKKIQRVLS